MPKIGEIVVEQLPHVSVVALCGEHDASTVPGLRAELDAVLAASANVIVDLSEATFIDSSIISALFDAATPPEQVITVAAVPGTPPRRLIDLVALTKTVPIFDSREAAVTHATKRI